MTHQRPLIGRVDLAKALEELVADDGRLAGALALCEAWEPGYLGRILTRAEVLVAADADVDVDVGVDVTGLSGRALAIVQKVLRDPDPKAVAERSGAAPTPEAIEALRQMLQSRAWFHEATDELERRGMRRAN
jgi:hypothetical protein